MNAEFLRKRGISLVAGLLGLGISAEAYALVLVVLVALYRFLMGLSELQRVTP